MRHAPSLLLAAALSAGAASAHAQADQTRTLFNAGAQAYEAGQFPAAIQAFEQAYKLSARPGILFSIAQAHRKQYFVAKSPQDLRAAVAGYRDYLAKVAQGGRRSDAAVALGELEPLAAKLDAGSAAPAAQAPQATRVMVSAQTAGATVSLDGAAPVEAPLFTEVKPGKHVLRVTAKGYFDEARDVEVAPGSVLALDVSLKDKPGHLAIRAGAGAQVSIDGRFVATTPLTQPLDVEPGRHVVSMTRNGFHAYSSDVFVERDETTQLEITLEGTRQRTASYVLFGVGAATAVASGVLVGLALHEQSLASTFDALRHSGGASCGPSSTDCATYVDSEYTSHSNARDDYRRDGAIALGAAVVVAGTGIVLFAFDQPTAETPMRRDDGPRPPSPGPSRERPMELSAAPLVAPGLYGAAVTGRF